METASERTVLIGFSTFLLVLALPVWAVENSSFSHQTLRGKQQEDKSGLEEISDRLARASAVVAPRPPERVESTAVIRLAPMTVSEMRTFKGLLTAIPGLGTPPNGKTGNVFGVTFYRTPVLTLDGGKGWDGGGGSGWFIAAISTGKWVIPGPQIIPNFPSILPAGGEWTPEHRVQIVGQQTILPIQFRNIDGKLEIRTLEGSPEQERRTLPILATLISRLVAPPPFPTENPFKDATVAIVGSRPDVVQFLPDFLNQVGRVVVIRNPLNRSDVEAAIQGAQFVFNLGNQQMRQSPFNTKTPENQPARLESQLSNNAATVALLGLLIGPNQQLLIASSTAAVTETVQADVKGRASRYLDFIGAALKAGTFSEGSLRDFIHQDLQENPVTQQNTAGRSGADYSQWVGEEIVKLIAARTGKDIRVVRISNLSTVSDHQSDFIVGALLDAARTPSPGPIEFGKRQIGVSSISPLQEKGPQSVNVSAARFNPGSVKTAPYRKPSPPSGGQPSGINAESFVDKQQHLFAVIGPDALPLVEVFGVDRGVSPEAHFIALVPNPEQADIMERRLRDLGISPKVGQVENLRGKSANQLVIALQQELGPSWDVQFFSEYTTAGLAEIARWLGVPKPDDSVKKRAEIIQEVLSRYP